MQPQQFNAVRGQRGRGNQVGRIAKGKWLGQRRRGNQHGFNGYKQQWPQYNFQFNGDYSQPGDHQRRKWFQRGSRGRFHGNRSKGNQDHPGAININATCNVTFLDSNEASNSMQDVGKRIAQQIVQQLIATCKNSSKHITDEPQIQVNVNLQNNDTVADNMLKGNLPKLHISSNAFQQSAYESQYMPNRQPVVNCTPSTVQQGELQLEKDCDQLCQNISHQPFLVEMTDGKEDHDVVQMAKAMLPGLVAYSPEYMESLDLTRLQTLCQEHDLLSDAPCLDLSKLELVELLNEHFANLPALCYCSQLKLGDYHSQVEYKQLPCHHLLCSDCFASGVGVVREGTNSRLLCAVCDMAALEHDKLEGNCEEGDMEVDQQGEQGVEGEYKEGEEMDMEENGGSIVGVGVNVPSVGGTSPSFQQR